MQLREERESGRGREGEKEIGEEMVGEYGGEGRRGGGGGQREEAKNDKM